jgi:Tol biopolymer transport system component
MRWRRTLGLAVLAGALVAVAALTTRNAGAETTTSLRGTIAVTGSSCACPSNSVQVYLLHLASGKLSQLTQGPVNHEALGWSPDGSRLLVGESGPGRQGLYSLRVDGRSQILLAKRADWSDAQWSPDGRQVAYLGPQPATAQNGTFTARHLYVVNADGKHRRLLAKRVLVNNGQAESGDFSWAPNGRRIVFFGNCNRPLFACFVTDNLVTVKTTGDRTMRLISWATRFLDLTSQFHVAPQPSWSPDGSRIAFQSVTPDTALNGLVVARTDGSHRKVIKVPGMIPRMSGYVWSPNSSWIAGYADSYGGEGMVVHSDGTGQRFWGASLSGMTFSPNSAMLAYVGGLEPGACGSCGGPAGALDVTTVDGSQTIQVLNPPSLYFDRPLWRGGTAETESGS